MPWVFRAVPCLAVGGVVRTCNVIYSSIRYVTVTRKSGVVNVLSFHFVPCESRMIYFSTIYFSLLLCNIFHKTWCNTETCA